MALIAGLQYSGTPAGTILPCGHGIAITSISAANPAVVTTTIAHGLITGDSVVISGTSTTPTTLGTYTITVTGTTTFTIPVNVTGAGGAAGAVSKIPTRMLLCDGSSYLRTTYPALFAAIGTSFGSADGNSFNVPDFRGRFLRGVTGASANDPDTASRTVMNTGGNTGNSVGSVQAYQLSAHTHNQGNLTANINHNGGNIYAEEQAAPASYTSNYNSPIAGSFGGPVQTDGVKVQGTTSAFNTPTTEARPLNAYVNYCIAY